MPKNPKKALQKEKQLKVTGRGSDGTTQPLKHAKRVAVHAIKHEPRKDEDAESDVESGDMDDFDNDSGVDIDDGPVDEDAQLKSVPYHNGLMDNLPWRKAKVSFNSDFEETGFYELEEIPAGSYDLVKTPEGGFRIVMKEAKSGSTVPEPAAKKKEKTAATDTSAAKKVEDDAGVKSGKKRPRSVVEVATSVDAEHSNKSTRNAHVPALPSHAHSLSIEEVKLSWGWLDLHPSILSAIARLGFPRPTNVQQACIPAAVTQYKDIVATAATGSGKTLAYSLPIIHRLLERREALLDGGNRMWKHCPALILTPTRELAVQVCDHINAVLESCTPMKAVAIVGGLSVEKQRRLLRACPDIVVATPGRLWDLIHTNKAPYLSDLKKLQFLVLDEADRLCEKGHFTALTSLLNALKQTQKPKTQEFIDETAEKIIAAKVRFAAAENASVDDDKSDEDGSSSDAVELFVDTPDHYRRQTFLFSATLGVTTSASVRSAAEALVSAASEGMKVSKAKARKAIAAAEKMSPVEALMSRVGILGKPFVVNVETETEPVLAPADDAEAETASAGPGDEKSVALTHKTSATKATHRTAAGELAADAKISLPAGLRLCRITCTAEEKDQNLYYFLAQYPGRTIIFVNAVSTLKRLFLLLSLLRLPVISLYANMQQKQRLKHLERFRADPNAILIATDVAARGLDIPSVQYVLHYTLPHSAEMFVHRCGRTARAETSGLTAAFISPADQKSYNTIMRVLGLDVGLPEFPVEAAYMRRIVSRMSVARKLSQAIEQINKESAGKHFVMKTAQKTGLTLDAEIAKEMGFDAEELAAMENEDEDDASKPAKRARHADDDASKPAKRARHADDDVSVVSDDETVAQKHMQKKKQNSQIRGLRKELDALLKESLLPAGVSTKYITSNPLLQQSVSVVQSAVKVDATSVKPAASGSALVAPRILLPDFGSGRGTFATARNNAIDVLSQKGKHVHVPSKKQNFKERR